MKPWAKNTANLIQSNTVHCTLWQLPAQEPLHSVKYKHEHHKNANRAVFISKTQYQNCDLLKG